MLKQKGPSYTSQMKSKVNYPKLKSKTEKKAGDKSGLKIEDSLITNETVVANQDTENKATVKNGKNVTQSPKSGKFI